jgi:hypothetical protein
MTNSFPTALLPKSSPGITHSTAAIIMRLYIVGYDRGCVNDFKLRLRIILSISRHTVLV